jgi:transcriptional regulator
MALLKGTLDVLVLKTLSWGPMHAFEITKWLEDRSGGRLAVEDAALMQALHRLEEREILIGEWGMTAKGRRARYYRLTSAGRVHLRAETKRLTEYTEALTTILAAQTAKAGER